jgi:hypothetical protein
MNNLNPFASSKNAVATNATEQKMASGSEQERYGSHFGINEKSVGNTVDRMKDAALNATTTKGTGSEQDRFQIHFGIDGEKIKAATKSWIDSSGKSLGLGHGLGYDGQQRAIQLANIQGVGAEQVSIHKSWGGIGD